MQFQPIADQSDRRRRIWQDVILAIVIAALLSLSWAINDWERLSRLLLPDTDDMMRLAQVRDWIAGQGINDWTQYRMAPPAGGAMHWSRINDVGVAALILAGTPALGRHQAELVAVIAYPAVLFACALYLSARIGRRLWGAPAGPIAAILTALAYPGTTVFIPGRIDHHALQVVLIQLFVLILMRAPSVGGGIAAGTVAGISLVVGLETAPQIAVLTAALCLSWVVRGTTERTRLGGFAAGLGATTLTCLLLLRPTYWTAALCDAFTPASSTATLLIGAALAVLAVATPRLVTWQWRFAIGAVLGGSALAIAGFAFPSCITGPYGAMDPFLRVAFMPYIDEANSIFAQTDLARAISLLGVLTAGTVAAAWMVIRDPRRWLIFAPIAFVVAISTLVMLVQVRGAYIGAPLSAPILAGLVLAARRRTDWRLPALAGAWLVGSGIAYLQLPPMIAALAGSSAQPAPPRSPQMICNSGDAWGQVAKYPAGVTMAPTSLAAYLIGATPHSTIGAGYHRNNIGNMAMYRFFLSRPQTARAIADTWHVDYVAFCPGDFEEISVAANFPGSLATALNAGNPPAWLQRLPLRDARLRFYRILR